MYLIFTVYLAGYICVALSVKILILVHCNLEQQSRYYSRIRKFYIDLILHETNFDYSTKCLVYQKLTF